MYTPTLMTTRVSHTTDIKRMRSPVRFGVTIDIRVNAPNWATEAKKKGEIQTGQRVITLVEGLNLSHIRVANGT